jgi:hypothetical protein
VSGSGPSDGGRNVRCRRDSLYARRGKEREKRKVWKFRRNPGKIRREVEKDFRQNFPGFSRRPCESSRCQTNFAICDNRATSEFVLGRANPC